jgi:hypothetical protein
VHEVKESYTQGDDSQKKRKIEINSANISRFYVRKQVRGFVCLFVWLLLLFFFFWHISIAYLPGDCGKYLPSGFPKLEWNGE